VGIHAATANFYEWPEGMQMMGGIFKGHPWQFNGTWAVLEHYLAGIQYAAGDLKVEDTPLDPSRSEQTEKIK
jgi:hypothetical protein